MNKITIPANRLGDKYDWIHFNAEEIKALLNGLRLRKKILDKELRSTTKKHWTLDAKRKIEIIEAIEKKIELAKIISPGLYI